MAPLLETWPAHQLPERAQISIKGPTPRKRKGWDGDLKGCELLEMMQYRCVGDDGSGGSGGKDVGRWKKDGVVRCWEVERLFRRYVLSLILNLISMEGGEIRRRREACRVRLTDECMRMRLILRFRCKDKEGTFMVETTAWEGRDEGMQDR